MQLSVLHQKWLSWGVVCRDSSGTVCFYAFAKRKAVHSPLQAKLLALLFGLEIARNKGYKTLQIETNSLLAFREIEKGFLPSCEWGNIVWDICNFVDLCDICSVGHVKREANSFAGKPRCL